MEIKEKTIKKNYIYKGSILNLRCDDIEIKGKAGKREVVEHSGGSAVLAICKDEVLFVRQYRYALGQTLLEIPAGKRDAGESPEAAAARELEEETGYSGMIKSLGFIYPSTGYTTEKIYLFYCDDALETGKGQAPDEDEFLSIVKIKYDQAVFMAVTGELSDAKTVTALLRYDAIKKGQNKEFAK